MSPVLISLAAFAAVAMLVAAVALVLKDLQPTKVEDRLQVLAGLKTPELEARGLLKEEVFREGVSGLAGVFHGLARRVGNLNNLFEQADSPISGNMFIGISVGAAFAGVLAATIARAPIPLFPIAAMVFGSLPLMWLMLRRRARFKRFGRQLPDALELVGRALRSGHSLAAGLHVVVDELPPPISTEFAIVYETQNLGVSIDQALKEMLNRMPNMDLKFFVTSVVIQRQTGGDMAEILDKISHIIRERFKILGQVQALTGEGRISGIILMALPVLLFLLIYYLNPDYVSVLFTDPLGKRMMVGAIILQAVGGVCIKKIVDIKI